MGDEQVFFTVVTGMALYAITLAAAVWALTRSQRSRSIADLEARFDSMAARLAHIQDAVETVAVEMERVAEGQRFTAKLLSDRPGPAVQPVAPRSASGEGRVNTPH